MWSPVHGLLVYQIWLSLRQRERCARAGTNRPPNAQTKASASASLLNRRRNAVPFPAASCKMTGREPRLLSQVIILLIAAMRSPQNEPTSTVCNILVLLFYERITRRSPEATQSSQPDHPS